MLQQLGLLIKIILYCLLDYKFSQNLTLQHMNKTRSLILTLCFTALLEVHSQFMLMTSLLGWLKTMLFY